MTPASPLRICLLGAGYIADWHAKAIAARGLAKVTAICDRDAFRAKATAAQFGAKALTSLDELVANAADIDAVHVLLPPQLHADATQQLLEAGLHTFVEKPFATNAADCNRLATLAQARGVHLGVSHNFLFVPAYEQLMAMVARGELGLIDSIRVTWAKELPQFSFGPHGHWMFAAPANVLLEVGPHNTAQALHAAAIAARNNFQPATPTLRSASCDKPIDLPRARSFRRWNARVDVGAIAVELEWSLIPGVVQHRIEIRGSMGNASVDLDRNVLLVEQPSDRATDFDNAAILTGQGKALARQGRRNLRNYLLAKARLGNRGNLFGATIADAVARFHQSLLGSPPDERLTATTGTQAVALCERIAAQATASLPANAAPAVPAPQPCDGPVDALVLGGGGFIGRALIRSLLAAGRSVRIMGRSAGNPGLGNDNNRVQAFAGDMRRPADLDRALSGAKNVFHLARGEGRTWRQWQESDVEATRLVAGKCLEHGVRRLVYTSTIAALDLSDPARTVTDDARAGDPRVVREMYARTKSANEALLLDLHTKGLDVVITRPGIVVGPGCTPFHSGVANWCNGRVVVLWGNGRNPLPFILVDDCADALERCIEVEGIGGRTFNLVGDVRLSAVEYIEELQQRCGLKFAVLPRATWRTFVGELNKWVVKSVVRHHERRIPRYREWLSRGHLSQFDTRQARQLLGWTPRADREEFVQRAIVTPAQQFIVGAAGIDQAAQSQIS